MKKKILCLVLAAVMLLALAACGSQTADDPKNDSPSSSNSSNSNSSTPVESSASSNAFKLGSIGPLTGDAAVYGTSVINGAKIAVDEINASNSAVKFEFKGEDDEADGEKSGNAYNTLMDWGMQVLVGPTTTGASITVADLANTDRTFMLTPSASSTDVINGKDNVFQVCFTDPNQGVASADYLAANMKGAKVAVIYRNDDAYSQGIRDTFVKEAAAKNLDIVYEGTFTDDTDTDFSVQLTAAKSAGADTVFLPIYYQPASVIFTQANAMGYKPTFFGVDGMDGILTIQGFDTSLAEGVMLLTPFAADATDERTQNFVKAYEAAYGETPTQFAADAYDGVYIVKAALEAAGCTADMSSADICKAILRVFTTISVDGLTGQGMTWDASGEVSKDPMAVVIKNGAYVTP